MGELTTKGKLLILLSLIVLLGGIFSLFWDFPWEKNSSPVIEAGKPVTPFSTLIVQGPIHVTHKYAPNYDLRLMGRREYIDSTWVIQKESVLNISKKMDTPHAPGRVFADILGNIRNVKVEQGAYFNTTGTEKLDSLRLTASGLSTMTISVPVGKLYANLEGRSHIHLADSVDTLILSVEDHARFTCEDGNIGYMSIEHSSDENVFAGCTQTIRGNISGAGNLLHPVQTDVDVETKGTGKAIEIEKESK